MFIPLLLLLLGIIPLPLLLRLIPLNKALIPLVPFLLPLHTLWVLQICGIFTALRKHRCMQLFLPTCKLCYKNSCSTDYFHQVHKIVILSKTQNNVVHLCLKISITCRQIRFLPTKSAKCLKFESAVKGHTGEWPQPRRAGKSSETPIFRVPNRGGTTLSLGNVIVTTSLQSNQHVLWWLPILWKSKSVRFGALWQWDWSYLVGIGWSKIAELGFGQNVVLSPRTNSKTRRSLNLGEFGPPKFTAFRLSGPAPIQPIFSVEYLQSKVQNIQMSVSVDVAGLWAKHRQRLCGLFPLYPRV